MKGHDPDHDIGGQSQDDQGGMDGGFSGSDGSGNGGEDSGNGKTPTKTRKCRRSLIWLRKAC
jgi:hypothetical protein